MTLMNPAPLALHHVVVVAPGGQAVIRLPGYDLDGDDLVATISSLPGSGALHQASDFGFFNTSIYIFSGSHRNFKC